MSDTDIKVYIAAPFFKDEQTNAVKMIEYELGQAGILYYSPRQEGILINMTPEEKAARMTDLFLKNVENLEWCTHVVAVIDDYDTGTVWEMGYAYCASKKIVSYSDHYYGINVMLNESIVAHCTRLKHIVPALNGIFHTEKGNDVT